MGKHISEKLCSGCHVMSSDEDQPVVMDIYAGFTALGKLTVCLDFYNYEQPSFNCSSAAVVDEDDARRMARRHKVRYKDLPAFIAGCMEDWREIINPDCRQVRECFREITECLLDEGCRFKMQRTYGKNGYALA